MKGVDEKYPMMLFYTADGRRAPNTIVVTHHASCVVYSGREVFRSAHSRSQSPKVEQSAVNADRSQAIPEVSRFIGEVKVFVRVKVKGFV
jgi:hypothetical protein